MIPQRIILMRPTRTDTGGEGSRGGKIIGHTSSGKPVYGDHKHPAHGKFTSQDHGEAALMHKKLADAAKPKKKRGQSYQPWLPERLKHSTAFEYHMKMNKAG